MPQLVKGTARGGGHDTAEDEGKDEQKGIVALPILSVSEQHDDARKRKGEQIIGDAQRLLKGAHHLSSSESRR